MSRGGAERRNGLSWKVLHGTPSIYACVAEGGAEAVLAEIRNKLGKSQRIPQPPKKLPLATTARSRRPTSVQKTKNPESLRGVAYQSFGDHALFRKPERLPTRKDRHRTCLEPGSLQ